MPLEEVATPDAWFTWLTNAVDKLIFITQDTAISSSTLYGILPIFHIHLHLPLSSDAACVQRRLWVDRSGSSWFVDPVQSL